MAFTARTKPLKRSKALQPISHSHHHGLLLCWKIRTGFKKNIPIERIKRYTDWFFDTYLLPHFELEERYLFPVLGAGHPLIKKALGEHRRLKRLFNDSKDPARAISLMEEELEAHIRFEERVLFNLIQTEATEAQLEDISSQHTEDPFVENETDAFWS